MSLILEALKKSEAERRIGQAPGLLTPSAATVAAKRPSPAWLWVLLAVLVVLALGAAWWLGRMGGSEPQASQDTPTVTAAVPTPAPTAAQPATAPATRSRDETSSRGNPAPAVAAPAQPRTADRSPATSRPALEESPRAQGERESLPVAPGELPAPPPPVAKPAEPRVTVAPDQPVTTSGAEPVREPPVRETLPRLHQLDSATRSELPPLRISMHVFTDAPGGRFVIIDNHRYAEGASVASGLNIAEIQRDGVVMEFRGRRFLLDRPG